MNKITWLFSEYRHSRNSLEEEINRVKDLLRGLLDKFVDEDNDEIASVLDEEYPDNHLTLKDVDLYQGIVVAHWEWIDPYEGYDDYLTTRWPVEWFDSDTDQVMHLITEYVEEKAVANEAREYESLKRQAEYLGYKLVKV